MFTDKGIKNTRNSISKSSLKMVKSNNKKNTGMAASQ
jgi:hypothetical protein